METMPRHVAIVMDGNGRWAGVRDLPKIEGHRAGAQAAKKLLPRARDLGIEFLTFFAFSKENWGREPQEIQDFFVLILDELASGEEQLQSLKVSLRVIGALEDLPVQLNNTLERLVDKTSKCNDLTVTLALSYGARQDMVRAVRRIGQKVSEGTLNTDSIDESLIEGQLSTAGLPPPDLFIRSSGELRLSNFLLWEIAYSELYFTTCLWPDFSPDHLTAACESYASRKRYFGKSRHV